MMHSDRLTDRWLFEQYPVEQVRNWVRQLRFFCFKRAWGGHAGDGDEFKAAISFSDRDDLLLKMDQLGLILNNIPDDFPRPVIGQPYSPEEYAKFKNEIKQFPGLEQPGRVELFGHKVFLWVYDNTIGFSVSGTSEGNPYVVTEDDFEVCLELERQLGKTGWKLVIDESLEKNICCITPSRYPELFEAEIRPPQPASSERKWWQKLFIGSR